MFVSSDCSQHPLSYDGPAPLWDGQTGTDQVMRDPGLTKDACSIIFVLVYLRSQQTFFCKGQRVNSLGFAGCTISVIATQLCHYSVKVAIPNM